MIAEAFRAGRRAGVDWRDLFAVMEAGGANAPLLHKIAVAYLPVNNVSVPGSRYRNDAPFNNSVGLVLQERGPQHVSRPKENGEKQESEKATAFGSLLQRRSAASVGRRCFGRLS